jgi:peptidoglycan hydrolase CwlO-like protein
MLKLQDLENQLKNLNVVFNDAFANQDISIEELKKIRAQISDLEKLISDRKVFLKGQDLNN